VSEPQNSRNEFGKFEKDLVPQHYTKL